jgi:hypothetical protein
MQSAAGDGQFPGVEQQRRIAGVLRQKRLEARQACSGFAGDRWHGNGGLLRFGNSATGKRDNQAASLLDRSIINISKVGRKSLGLARFIE